MTDSSALPVIENNYGTLRSMLRKFERFSRQNRFTGSTTEEFVQWRIDMRQLISDLLGLEKMESCPLNAQMQDYTVLPDGIRREHWTIQTEPDVIMPFFLLIPPEANNMTVPFLCPCGHGGAGKYSVAGLSDYGAVAERIEFYGYDYGLYLAKLGFVTLCPDARGFGERRENLEDTRVIPQALKGDCARLAHMGEPLGIPVAGMLTWDLMRACDYLLQRGDWNYSKLGIIGFSGGGMQALWLSALDDRVKSVVISGYLYGARDALLILNENCSCNYVPHLWEHLDIGDVASLIAPRPMLVQSCRNDRLNGPRGLQNVEEQIAVVRSAYKLFGDEKRLVHQICEGPHHFHQEGLQQIFKFLLEQS